MLQFSYKDSLHEKLLGTARDIQNVKMQYLSRDHTFPTIYRNKLMNFFTMFYYSQPCRHTVITQQNTGN